MIFNVLHQQIVFDCFLSAFTIEMLETIFADANIFTQTDAKFLGQHINSYSRVIHMSLPANKIKLFFVFAVLIQTACSPVSPVRMRKALSTA
jgi:hypothetical protein